MQGFITVPRAIREWPSWQEASPAHRQVLLELAMSAQWKAETARGVELEPGQCLTSQRALAADCNCSRKAVRRGLERWEAAGVIERRDEANRTLVTILPWDKFQGEGRAQGRTHRGPTPDEADRAQGRTHPNGETKGGAGGSYDKSEHGADPEADPPEKSPENATRTQDRTHQGARATGKKLEEVNNNPPSGTSSPLTEDGAGEEKLDVGVGVPSQLRDWLQRRNGSIPQDVRAEFWREVRRAADQDLQSAADALRELAGDPPDHPEALVSYWQTIYGRHHRSALAEDGRMQRLDSDMDLVRERRQKAESLDEEDARAGSEALDAMRQKLRQGKNSEALKAEDNARDENGGESSAQEGSQTTLDGGRENEDGSVTREIGDDEEIPF